MYNECAAYYYVVKRKNIIKSCTCFKLRLMFSSVIRYLELCNFTVINHTECANLYFIN